MLDNLFLLQAVIVGVLIMLVSIVCDVRPFWLTIDRVRTRMYKISPYIVLLTVIYLFNRSSHTVGQRFSTQIGLNISTVLYALEGDLVVDLQGIIPYDFTGYFTFIYLFGFTFVLTFPIVAYSVLPSRRYLEELLVAYAINYGGGAVCYVLFIAYGPRNVIPRADEPMYNLYPEVATLTSSVNSSANVFPSLHASLTVLVVLFAWRTRDVYPRWLWIAAVAAVQIIIATMFLGIHWLIDVIAGFGLAVISIKISLLIVDRVSSFENESEALDRQSEQSHRLESPPR